MSVPETLPQFPSPAPTYSRENEAQFRTTLMNALTEVLNALRDLSVEVQELREAIGE